MNTPALAPNNTEFPDRDRNIPHLHWQTIKSLQQSIVTLSQTITSMEQAVSLLKTQYDEVQEVTQGKQPHPPSMVESDPLRYARVQSIVLQQQIQEQEQRIATLREALNQASLQLVAMPLTSPKYF